MQILRADRGQGKTVELVRQSNKDWQYIICKDENRLNIIAKTAEKLGLDIPHPITINELPLRSPHIKGVLMDDMEDILEAIVGKPIDLASTSCQVIDKNNGNQIDKPLKSDERKHQEDNNEWPCFIKIFKY